MKKCSRCGVEKPLEEFHRRSETPSGRVAHCKACAKKRSAAYYKANKEKICAKTNAYRRENLEKGREYTRRWRAKNPPTEEQRQRAREATKAWCEANPEWKKQTDREYYERTYARQAIYRNQGRTKFPADADTERWLEIVYNDPCPYCGEPMEEIDHIDPLTHWHKDVPGWNSWSNLTSSCQSCNRRKNARPLLMFLLKRT